VASERACIGEVQRRQTIGGNFTAFEVESLREIRGYDRFVVAPPGVVLRVEETFGCVAPGALGEVGGVAD
jgi:hypothetical protein